MNNNFSVLLKKYSVPVIFSILGLVVLFFGIKTGQGGMFLLASVFLFVAALISLLYSSGKVKPGIVKLIGFVALVAAILTIFLASKSVSDTKEHQEKYKLSKLKAQQNLSDIRFIQKRHLEVHGEYAGTWSSFTDYAKDATMDYVDAAGVVPGRKLTQKESRFIYKDNRPTDNLMTEDEAYILANSEMCPPELKGFRRDTIKVNLLKTKFGSASYIDNREINNLGRFSLDSLPIIPFTKREWNLETADAVMGADTVKAIKVSGMMPFAMLENGKPEEMYFGNLGSNDTGGSWE